MIVAMKHGANAAEVEAVISRIKDYGMRPVDLPGGDRTAIGVASSIPPDMRDALKGALESLSGVDHVTNVSRTYKLTSREFHQADTVINIKGVEIGGSEVVVMAGPCAIETRDYLMLAAETVRKNGGKMLRGGAFKPRTSPYSFQGLGIEGLKYLREAGEEFGLVTVTEVMDQHDLDVCAEHVDVLQIGARNMQNFSLLTALGKISRPVIIKRGVSATVDEWLLAAEYVLANGNERVILCERGIHPLDRDHIRYTLDLSSVPVAKHLSHLPVIVDPSHSSGNWRWVSPMARAAVAAGADGILVEIHPDPKNAKCDGPQALSADMFADLMGELRGIASAVGRNVAGG